MSDSTVVEVCQSCQSKNLEKVLFLGYMPPVNQMTKIGERPCEQAAYPAEVLNCRDCHLVQLGLVVDPKILFPESYPYTSSTTKILRENFADLARESHALIELKSSDLVIDIGSNDGNLLSNFKSTNRVLGVTPEDIGKIAVERGIPTLQKYFNKGCCEDILQTYGKAKIVCATNVFAHIDNVHEVIDNIESLLTEDGVFISESHYLLPLVQTLQYDTVYHEHLRYYSLVSLQNLLEKHGFKVFHVKQIPTHGGSIRVYASKSDKYSVQTSVMEVRESEVKAGLFEGALTEFAAKVAQSKLDLVKLFSEIKGNKKKVFGVSAPSRASTLINYCAIDEYMLDCVVEIKGSHKIGKSIPGTTIPILDEEQLYKVQPDYALLLSWHIADELMPKLRKQGYKGKFIVPLPEPRIVNE